MFTIFEKLEKDFQESIGNLCDIKLGEDENFQNITSKIYTFIKNLEEKLLESSNQSDNEVEKKTFTKEDITSICKSLKNKDYPISYYDKGLISLDEITLHKNCYILTTLIFDGSGNRLTPESKVIYNNLKDLLNNKLLKKSNLLEVLNDPKKARNALISWNILASSYRMVVQQKICENMIKRNTRHIDINDKIYQQISKAILQNNINRSLEDKANRLQSEIGLGGSQAVSIDMIDMDGGARKSSLNSSRKSSKGSSIGSRRSSRNSSKGSSIGSRPSSRKSSKGSSIGSRRSSRSSSRGSSIGSRRSSRNSSKGSSIGSRRSSQSSSRGSSRGSSRSSSRGSSVGSRRSSVGSRGSSRGSRGSSRGSKRKSQKSKRKSQKSKGKSQEQEQKPMIGYNVTDFQFNGGF